MNLMNLHEIAYDNQQKFIIALDGPSASGKGLIGSMLAKEFCLTYFQSSLVYRGLAYICIQDNININNLEYIIKLSKEADIFFRIKNIDLNIESIGDLASKLSIAPEVRENLGRYLQKIIINNPRIIMEGRDIGTIIAPSANLKIFITADVAIRAERRFKQLRLDNKTCTLSSILNNLQSRDERDKSRESAPLVPALDAHIIDTTNLEPNQVLQKIKDIINRSA